MNDLNIKGLLSVCLLSASALISSNVIASECGILYLQSNRSSGVSVSENKCQEGGNISVGTVFDVAAKGRLWLKSINVAGSDLRFNLICQNKTKNTVKMEFSGNFLPWLNTAKLTNCSHWINNKLRCEDPMGETKGIVCVLSPFKQSSANKLAKVERTTSVKMRGVNPFSTKVNDSTPFNKQLVLEDINYELSLCKAINTDPKQVQVQWVLEPSMQVKDIETTLLHESDEALSDCVKTVVATYPYPQVSKITLFTSLF